MSTTRTKKSPPTPAATDAPSIRVDGTVLRIDPEDLTLGELDDFERECGTTLEDLLRGVPQLDDEDKPVRDPKTKKVVRVIRPSTRQIIVLVWLVKRRDDPAFTIEQARNIKVQELQIGVDPQ